jgi:hypothetical protein
MMIRRVKRWVGYGRAAVLGCTPLPDSRMLGQMKRIALLVFASGWCGALAEEIIPSVDFEAPEHGYYDTQPRDPFSKLASSIAKGQLAIDTSSETRYLGDLLKVLNVPASSQALVYSATSLQLSYISIEHPRAMYFNEDVYVGHVRGGRIEVISMDPELGAIFSIFDVPRKPGQPVTVERSERCMNCHANGSTGRVPGVVLKSVMPGPNNGSLDSYRRDQIGHQVPLADRFGGWHVTGAEGFSDHRGNLLGRYVDGKIVTSPALPGQYADLSVYLRPSSDILPLLVLDHQAAFTNKLTELVYRWRGARVRGAEAGLQEKIDEFVRYTLFADEVPLPKGGFPGDPDYRRDFAAAGRTDSQGRSWREFDLKTRMFRYRCSYMLDTALFRGIPVPLQERIFGRMRQALDPAKPDPRYAYLPVAEKTAIVEILRGTMFARPSKG